MILGGLVYIVRVDYLGLNNLFLNNLSFLGEGGLSLGEGGQSFLQFLIFKKDYL
jgi:hypothetical protein